MDNSIIVALKNIVVDFDGEPILTGLSLDIHDKEFVTLLGPSGCGKTTTLRVIGGFVEPRSGNVFFAGRDITRLPPYKRQVNTVFQKYALFPHLNVFENVAFGLRLQKLDEKEIRSRCLEMLELVGLKGYERRNTAALSGGQQQRVAIARALVNHPKVLLLDEPLGALDLKLRKDMQIELKRIQQSLDITFIYVTHDQEEALTMSDTVVVMNRGDIQQIGSPEDIYNEPQNAFVADFIGEANFLRGKMTGTENGLAVLDVEGERLAVAPREGMRVGEEYTVVLRPESAALSDEGGLPCTVELSCFMGSYQNYHVRVGNTLVKLAENDPRNKRIFRVGEQCHLTFAPDAVHVL